MWSTATAAAPAGPSIPVAPTVPTKNEVDAADIFKPPGRWAECWHMMLLSIAPYVQVVQGQDLQRLPTWSRRQCCCRDRRPAKIAVIMRGLPGSGKTFIAKALRDLEVSHGGEAPRIHALDDYFVTVSPGLFSAVKRHASDSLCARRHDWRPFLMRHGSVFLSDVRLQEVEKEVVEEEPGMKPKKQKVMVMDYLYEQELEGGPVLLWCRRNQTQLCLQMGGEASSQQHQHLFADERDCGVQSLTSRAS